MKKVVCLTSFRDFLAFVLNKRLSSFQTFCCVFKTVFVFIRLCVFCAFYKVVFLTLYAFCTFCVHKDIYEERHFSCFFVLVGSFLKRNKTSPMPSFTILIYHYNTFQSSQCFFITTVLSHYHKIFLLLQSFSNYEY